MKNRIEWSFLRYLLLLGWMGAGCCLAGCVQVSGPTVGPSATPVSTPSVQPAVAPSGHASPSPPQATPVASPMASPSSQPTLSPSALPAKTPEPPQATPSPVAFQTISQIIDLRCSTCHGLNGGVSLRSSEQILQAVPRIKVRVVEQKSMPPGGLPETERALIGRWIAEGARLNP